MTISAAQIRWRLNDPAEEWRECWTKVHFLSSRDVNKTVCHMKIPEHAIMTDTNEQIPDGAPRCKRCLNATSPSPVLRMR